MKYQVQFGTGYKYRDHEGISLPIALSYGDRKASFRAALDTGASVCVFQRRHAERLGLHLEAGLPTRIATVTGTFSAYAHEVTIDVLEIKVDAMVYFAADPAMPRDVLGRMGWLDRIRLGLIHHDEQIYLSYYDD